MKVEWSPVALAHLDALQRYIAARNPAAATRVAAQIAKSAARLGLHPRLGRLGRIAGSRELVVPRTPYIVAYEIMGDVVIVHLVRHHAQQWPTAFKMPYPDDVNE